MDDNEKRTEVIDLWSEDTKQMPGLVRVPWMSVFIGWRKSSLASGCIYSLVSKFFVTVFYFGA